MSPDDSFSLLMTRDGYLCREVVLFKTDVVFGTGDLDLLGAGDVGSASLKKSIRTRIQAPRDLGRVMMLSPPLPLESK